MAPPKRKRTQKHQHRRPHNHQQRSKAQDPAIEIAELERRCVEQAPAEGYAPPLDEQVAFHSLPLSGITVRALVEHEYTTMTAIQNACIPHALAGRDILGAAKTGRYVIMYSSSSSSSSLLLLSLTHLLFLPCSGKTLAFLIPLLECLYRHRFTPSDGPGAVVLSPTRELAMQIFQVLRQVGQHHAFSVGLLIGGKKDFYTEQQQIGNTNILIATPGRLLQHLEQTPYLDMNELKILVLDEADRILDMGFRDQLLRILDYLPQTERQTLLFSATQTKDVASLATLSLNNPQYLGVHDTTENLTPDALQQSYVVVPLEHKLNAIFSFLKSHLQSKSIIFFSTCAQVRHANDLFCSLRPGIPVLGLHGKLSQEKRTHVYFSFCQRPDGAVLFCTDMCARGLDFPNVDWVVQADAPEDRATYIHRVGRTARYRNKGNALLFITPAEDEHGYVDTILQQQNGKKKNSSNAVSQKQLPLQRLSINPRRATVVTERAASLVAANTRLHSLAKKAFQSHCRSLHLLPQPILSVQDDVDTDGYATSLGLAITPNLQFLKTDTDRTTLRAKKNVNHKLQRLKEQIKQEKLAKRLRKLGSDGGGAPAAAAPKANDEDSDEDDLLVAKQPVEKNEEETTPSFATTDLQSLKSSSSRSKRSNQKIIFDDDGNEATSLLPQQHQPIALEHVPAAAAAHMDAVRARLERSREQDVADDRERVRQKHKKRRMDSKLGREIEEDAGVTLGANDDGDAAASSSSDSDSSSDDQDDASSSSSSSSGSDDEDEAVDLKAQEDLALALIRNSS